MKIHTIFALGALLQTTLIYSCSKSSDSGANPPKDYTAVIKSKTWWGTFTYTGINTEYYSVYFDSAGTLVWDEFGGPFGGHWLLDDKKLSITFDGSSALITADISDSNTLININNNTVGYEINSGRLLPNPHVNLENSVWIGFISVPGHIDTLDMTFKTSQVNIMYNSYPVGDISFIRSASGGAVRTGDLIPGYKVFCILTSDTDMKGSYSENKYPVQFNRQ